MELMHLSDDELQAYLDDAESLAVEKQSHLQSCSRCREALRDYRALYGQLADLPDPLFSKDFAERVATKAQKQYAPLTRLAIGLAAAMGAVAGIVLASFFVDLGLTFALLLTLLQPFTGPFTELAATVQSLLHHVNVDLSLIVTGIAVAIVIHLLDRFYRKHRHHPASFMI